MKLMKIFKGKKPLMPGDPGFDYFDPILMKAAFEALPPEQRVLKIESATYLDRVQKAESNVLFGPTASNSAHALRNAARGFQSHQQVQELSAEHAHALALQAWLDGGSIGKRPQLSDFSATHRTLSQKAEALSTRLSHCIDNLFASGI